MRSTTHKTNSPAIAGGTDVITTNPSATAGGTHVVLIVQSRDELRRTREMAMALALTILASLFLMAPTELFANPRAEQRRGRAVKRQITRSFSRAEMKAAEARLAEMGYGTGQGALINFQKWERRKVTGRMSREDHDAIMNAEAPRPKDSGYKHVEVDLDRQVLLLIDDDGAIKKILPVSTGSNKQYREKGGSGLAYTPRGRFRIINKIAGWRKSPLGLLYYPSYFSGGVAIHGNPSVPTTPQSHGCIRIPMSAAVSVFKQLPVGTIVLIYDDRGFVSGKDWAAADKLKHEAATAKETR